MVSVISPPVTAKHLQKNTHSRTQSLDIKELVHTHYGLDVACVTLLSGELDGNYQLTITDHPPLLLKICKIDQVPFDDSSIRIFSLLENINPSLPVQRIVPLLNGENYSYFRIAEEPFLFYLLSFIEGTTLANHSTKEELFFADLGKKIALLDYAMQQLPLPSNTNPLIWDIQQLPTLADFLPYVPTEHQRQTQEILHAYQELLNQKGMVLPKQMIHNDFNPHNIIVDSQGTRVVGILDFGDMVYSHRINNLAIACSYFFTDNPQQPLQYILPLVQNYHACNPLSKIEQEAFFTCVAARLATTMLITHRRVHVNPENQTYILRNVPPTLLGLSFFRNTPQTSLQQFCSILFPEESI